MMLSAGARVALVFVPLITLLTSTAAVCSGYTVLAISKSGLMHLDSSGELLAWRSDTNLTGNAVSIPQNNTVCWVRYQGDPTVGGARRLQVRCADLANLNRTWDLSLGSTLGLSAISAISFEWDTRKWYLTGREDLQLLRGDTSYRDTLRGSYVCSYHFDKCLLLAETDPLNFLPFRFAYDIPARLMFHVATKPPYNGFQLNVTQLDGKEVGTVDVDIRYPGGIAVDPVRRDFYWLDHLVTYAKFTDMYRIDYDGQNRRRIKRLHEVELKTIDVLNGTAVIAWRNQTGISVIDGKTGELTDLVSGSVRGQTIPALMDVKNLLTVKLISSGVQLEAKENPCGNNNGGCHDFCIPTMVDNSSFASCFCKSDQQLVEIECRKKWPNYALVIGANRLQVVDLQTKEVATILSNLTDGTRVDVLRSGEREFLLVWVDAGSLYRARWAPYGSVRDVQLLVPATETARVVEVALYTSQEKLYWAMRDDSDAGTGSKVVVQRSPVDGSYVETVFVDNWKNQTDKVVYGTAFMLVHHRFVRQRRHWHKFGDPRKPRCDDSKFEVETLGDFAMEEPLHLKQHTDRFFWIERATQSVQFLHIHWAELFWSSAGPARPLLSHPSLATATSLDITDSHLFWIEHSTGKLWTADIETGSDIRVLATTYGRALRVTQPWWRPSLGHLCGEDRSGCSHFCDRVFVRGLSTKMAKTVCSCPDGMSLGEDQKTCQIAEVAVDQPAC